MGEIVIFSKANCPHCVEAKAVLAELNIPFTEIDVEDDLRNSMLMSRVSGHHTVPQIFFNEQLVGGTNALKNIAREDIKLQAEAAIKKAGKPAFLTNGFSDKELESAVIPIKNIIDPHIPNDPTSIPEYAAVRIWYGSMFGFLCNLYDQMILKPKPTALWMAVLGAAMEVVEKRIGADFGTACFSTAIRAGCSYCSAHGADLSMKYAAEAPENFKSLVDYLKYEKGSLDELPFSDELKVIINLCSKMTDHSVTAKDIEHARSIFGTEGLREICDSAGSMGIIMGFLNRFNDLIGVEIEASIKQSIDNSLIGDDWQWGTHDTADSDNRYPIRDESQPPPDPEQMNLATLITDVKLRVLAEVEPILSEYTLFPEQHLPIWIASLPNEDTIRTVTALYHSLFNTGDVDAETKHLAAYALALGSGYSRLAEEEARIIRGMSTDIAASEAKIDLALSYANSGQSKDLAELSKSVQLALRLAKCSDNFPHIVRGELVRELAEEFSAVQIIELVMALAVIGMGQRWVSVNEPFAEHMFG